ncbi:phosphatidate cytidylyltransferase [Thaumasiovibrio sp. DFM-14]|uniref:phosphatidate cytidylyltransferase n=1 Tax=Thaumasiovibrio sp. DFM-14 TaxID=3384792 RepID=UPI00399FCD11
MKQRVLTALILAPLVVAGIFFLPFSAFMLALFALTVVGFWEWSQFTRPSHRVTETILMSSVLLLSVLVVPTDLDALQRIGSAHKAILAVGAVWWLFASWLVITYPASNRKVAATTAIKQCYGLLTLLPFFWSMLMLRAYDYHVDSYNGAQLVMLVCFLVWAADSGAYFAGRAFGRRKMAPAVSPNKTMEGLFGGIVAAIIVTGLVAMAFGIPFKGPFSLLVIAMITVVISVMGDLVESMFKRVSGIKDSGRILPGHGGILDRIDSLTAALPVFALLYLWLL